MRYQLEKLSSAEFEVLAANYVNTVAPMYNWQLTKETVDFNRDFEANDNGFNKWGEAKHTAYKDGYKRTISKSQWDPTIVSAVLKNNVNEIYLVTCGWTPLEYIDRAEHFRQNRQKVISNIYYINRFILDKWLEKADIMKFQNFNKPEIDIVGIMQRIKCDSEGTAYHDNCINISVYNIYGDLLETAKEVYSEIVYEVNITAFTQKEIVLNINIPCAFKIIDMHSKYLSVNDVDRQDVILQNEPYVEPRIIFTTKAGYNRISLAITFNSMLDSITKRKCILSAHFADNSCKASKALKIRIRQDENVTVLSKIENAYMECCQSGDNLVMYAEKVKSLTLGRASMLNGDGNYSVFHFGNSLSQNAIELCRLFMLIILGIDYIMDCTTDFYNILNAERPFFPAWINKILVGTTDSIFAVDAIENFNEELDCLKISNTPFNLQKKSLLLLNGYNLLDSSAQNVLDFILNHFKTEQDASLIVLNKLELNDENAYKSTDSSYSLIDALLSEQTLASNEVNDILNVANKHYQKTEFPQALFYFKLLYRKCNDMSMLNDSTILFRYADCLNHCGSLHKAQTVFEKVVNLGSEKHIYTFLEAKTEIFNIRFWRLDVDGLVDEINTLLNEYGEILTADRADIRCKYALYNCYNRKMVTQYLVGDYVGAEETFQSYIAQTSENYTNYLAFAYMDSARGLYNRNVLLAQCRLCKAMEILTKLNSAGQEHRRYLDCVMETEYVNFIIAYENGTKPGIEDLTNAVIVIRNEGYTNMAIKGYLKLAACCLAMSDLNSAERYLNYVQIHSDFEDAPRVGMLYNMLWAALHNVRKSEGIRSEISPDYNINSEITFTPNKQGKLLLDARIW